MGTVERIKAVAEKVKRFRDDGHQIVVVVSAMSGETNRLIDLASQINEDPTPREMDMLVSTGEQVTISLLAMALHQLGVPATSYTGAQVGIRTDSAHTKARIQRIETDDLKEDLAEGQVVVVAGFQGVDEEGNTPPSVAAGRTLPAWRWPRPWAPTSARYTPTWTGSTPPTRGSAPRRSAWSASPSRR